MITRQKIEKKKNFEQLNGNLRPNCHSNKWTHVKKVWNFVYDSCSPSAHVHLMNILFVAHFRLEQIEIFKSLNGFRAKEEENDECAKKTKKSVRQIQLTKGNKVLGKSRIRSYGAWIFISKHVILSENYRYSMNGTFWARAFNLKITHHIGKHRDALVSSVSLFQRKQQRLCVIF